MSQPQSQPAQLTNDLPVLRMPDGRVVKPWLVLLSIVFGFFMSLLDATISNIALDNIQASLKTDLTTVSWVLNAYILTFAALLVTTGRLADQFGRKRIYMGGMILFSLGSLLCALAPTIELLITFRVVQAIGASVLEAVSLAIILAVFPRDKRTAAIGIWGALAGLAAAVGPVLGGFLLEIGKGNFEWRWIFFVNLPFCLVGLIMIARNVPEMRDPQATRRVDLAGVVTLTIGVFCLALGFTQATDWGWGSAGVLGLFGAAVLALVGFYLVETRQAQPILDFGLFKFRSFTATCTVGIMFTIAFQGIVIVLIQYFIIAQGKSPLDAALAIIWMPLAAFVSAAASGAMGDKFSPRSLIMLGMFLMGVGLLALYTLPVDASYLDTVWREAIAGLGAGFCFTSLPNIALSQVPRAKLGAGSGAYNTFQELGFVLGIAIFISLLTGQFKTNFAEAKTQAVAQVQAAPNLPTQAKAAIITGLANTGSPAQGSTTTNPATSQNQDNPLSQQIAGLFKKATLDSFTFVWFAAAMFALFGIIPALFTSDPKPSPTADSEEGEFEPAIEFVH